MPSPELEKSEKEQIEGAEKRTVKTSGNYEVCEHVVQDMLRDHTIVKTRKSKTPSEIGSMTRERHIWLEQCHTDHLQTASRIKHLTEN